MARWDHGYVTDVAYTAGVYQETTPSWLAASAVLLGYRPPDLAGPFRYADFGCGNGLSIVIAAANHPDAVFWGFDFNPAHIENARLLAAAAGLTNVHFKETSFEALAQGDAAVGEAFDLVVAHGVLSWVSIENRRHLTACLGRWLRPGGLAYLSYNTTTGWSGMEPIRLLMWQLASASQRRSDQTVADLFQTLDQVRNGGALFFQTHAGLEARLTQMKTLDPRYIAHEFLNRDWHPLMFAEAAEAMEETRTTYIGSATLTENIDAISVQEKVLPILNGMPDLRVRETIRDMASSKSFRRDLWRKGAEPLVGPEHLAFLDAMTLAWTGKAMEAEFTVSGPIGVVTGQPDFYRPLLNAIRAAPVTIGQLRALPEMATRQTGEFIQAALLLIGSGFAHPTSPAGGQKRALESAARLNAAIIGRVRLGVDLQRLAAPVIGSSVTIGPLDGLAIGCIMDRGPGDTEALIDEVHAAVTRSGRSMVKDGQPLHNPVEARALVRDVVHDLLTNRLAPMRALGVMA